MHDLSNGAESAEADRFNVVIAVCTCKRNLQLEKCIESIAAQVMPSNWQLSLVVIENDATANAQSLVEKIARTAPFPVHYQLETRQGIPYARNCALDAALREKCDWILFIDDDETAADGWLQGYAEALRRYSADVIHGRVIYQLPVNDRWVHLLKRNAANDLREEGKKVRSAATNNVLIASRLFSPSGLNLRFDIAFQFSGGSDTEFFNRAGQAGASIVYSAMPIVHETVPIERCSLKWLLQREARTTAASVCIDVRHYGKATAVRKHSRRAITNLFQSAGYLLKAVGYLLVKPDEVRRQLLIAILRLGRCYGRLLGLSGRMLSPYKTINSVEAGPNR